jgi:hypothetical protein
MAAHSANRGRSEKNERAAIRLRRPDHTEFEYVLSVPASVAPIAKQVFSTGARPSQEKTMEMMAQLVVAACPDNVAILDSVAALMWAWRNHWAALHFLVRRLAVAADDNAAMLHDECIAALGDMARRLAWALDLGLDKRSEILAVAERNARREFAVGRLADADDALVLFYALKAPFMPPLPPLTDLRRAGGAYIFPATTEWDRDAQFHDTYPDENSPNRVAFARLIADHLRPGANCLEIGCYSGSLLRALQAELHRREQACALFGIEPVRAAVAHLQRSCSHATIIEGDVAALAAGRFDPVLPDTFEVVCLSGVCSMLAPEEMDALLTWASQRCRAIAIADDVVNLDGDAPVARGPYTLHAYRLILARTGFDVATLVMVPELAQRGFSGFIAAVNRDAVKSTQVPEPPDHP